MKITKTLSPSTKDIEFLTKKINEETADKGSAYDFAFFIRDNMNEIIAGCNGSVIYGSIYTDQLWVDKAYRNQGLGYKLMDAVHAFGIESGCDFATASTMDFQNAEGFYKKLGYKVDFERADYTDGSVCLFLKKKL